MNGEVETLPKQDQLMIFLIDMSKAMLSGFIEDKNWIVGLLMSAELIEGAGKAKLKLKFRRKIAHEKIDASSLDEISTLLFASRLIDEVHYGKFLGVRKMRNLVAHNLWKKADRAGLLTQKKSNPQAKKVIEDAMECLEALFPSREKVSSYSSFSSRNSSLVSFQALQANGVNAQR